MPYPNVGAYNPGFNNGFGRYNAYNPYQPTYPGQFMYGGDPMMYQNQMAQQQPIQQAQPQQTPPQTPQQTMQPQTTNIPTTPNISASPNQVWVNGMEGAKAYPMIPNTSVMLMDSENSRFYIKTADINGKRTIETYVYQREDESETPSVPQNQPVFEQTPSITKEDIQELESRLMAKFDGLQTGYDDIIAAVNNFNSKTTANTSTEKQSKPENKDKDRDKK